MKRRTLLKLLALAPLARQAHAQTKATKGIKEMQDNWKSLLAPGTPTPSPTEELKLSKDEWRKRVEAWRAHGATHVAVDTMRAGFKSPQEHIDAIRSFREVLTP